MPSNSNRSGGSRGNCNGSGSSTTTKKKKTNGNGSSSTTTTKTVNTIKDVEFKIGDARSAANFDANFQVLLAHIGSPEANYGDYRHDIVTALDTDTAAVFEEPTTSFTNPHDATTKKEAHDAWNLTIPVRYEQALKTHQARCLAYQSNNKSAAALMYSKCTKNLKERLESAVSNFDAVKTDALKLKKEIKKYSTSFRPEAHPLMQVVDALRAFVTFKQTDEENVETYAKKLKSVKKVLVERLGCKIVPINCMKSKANYDMFNDAKYQNEAWDELATMIGVLGAHDGKYKSMKEELKNDWTMNQDHYPKTIESLLEYERFMKVIFNPTPAAL